MTGLRYTWSRVAANVVEHVATPPPDLFGQPVCGRELSAATQTFGPRNESYPECSRCAAIMRRVEAAAARFFAETERFPVEPTDKNLRRVFANVVRPIKPELYPLVRDRVTEIRAERAQKD